MSIDRSLKLKGALVRHRNVLTRTERLKRLKDEEKWEDGDSIFGLVKVANRKVAAVKKEPKKAAAVEGAVPGAEGAAPGAAPAAAGKGAPAAKGAAPAGKAGAAPAGKGAAPAGKAAPAAKPAGGKK